MNVLRALLRGLTFAVSWPKLVAWLWLVSVVVAFPAAVYMGASVRTSIGKSLEHKTLLDGLDLVWLGEYQHQAKGIERTLTASALTSAAVFDNLETWFNGKFYRADRALLALCLVYILIWTLMLGGILDLFARGPDRFRLGDFLTAGVEYFFRLLRLTLLSGLVYFLIYRLARRIFPWIEEATKDFTAERTILVWNLLGALLIVILLCLVNMIFDYAKIATVRERRRSMVLAAFKGLVFVVMHPLRTFGVYYSLGLVALLLPILYFFLGPGTGQSTWTAVLIAMAVGQLYIVARLLLRLTFYGAELAMYDSVGHRRTLELRT